MPPRKAKPKFVAPKGLCLYLAEVDVAEDEGRDKDKGLVRVPEESIQLLRSCIIDKIESQSQDHVGIFRSDKLSNFTLIPEINLATLKKMEEKFREGLPPPRTTATSTSPSKGRGRKRESSGGAPTNVVEALLELCLYARVQDEEDSYAKRKVVLFGLLKNQTITEAKVKELGKELMAAKIDLSVILPNEEDMDDQQKENCNYLRNVLETHPFFDNAYICTLQEARKQIMNTLTDAPKKSMPWNVDLEIGEDLTISVSLFVCTRANTSTVLKAKSGIGSIPPPEEATTSNGGARVGGTQIATTSRGGQSRRGGNTENDAEEGGSFCQGSVDLVSTATERETVWKEKDGTVVDADNVGKAYDYGGKLVPFNELEAVDTYDAGPKCMKVLLFCPEDRIHPAFLQGDGTSVVWAKKGDREAEVKFDALFQALIIQKEVAIVRKVYRKGTRVLTGVLSPDMDRKCLVFAELCFADDVSIPNFPHLIKPEEPNSEDSEGVSGLSMKDDVMDKFIKGNIYDGVYCPFEGMVDPARFNMRQNAASRALDSGSAIERPKYDILDIYFKGQSKLDQTLTEPLNESFPLTVNDKFQATAPSGANIFRKREAEDELEKDGDGGKKSKATDTDEPQESANGNETREEVAMDDYDDLLDAI